MPLSWNEIRSRAHEFSRRWAGEESERAEAQSFWNEFFDIFGLDRKRVASFEKQVQLTRAGEKLKNGRIDAFWKGTLLIEHKSAGQDLDRAFAQAIDYFDGLAERDLPRYILVSDFARFRLYDLEGANDIEFKLADLHKRIKHFAFVAGYRTQEIAPQNPVNIKAAERMGALHDLLKASGYTDHALELLLVRLLFCLFAEDTGIFQPASAFRLWLDERTDTDGADLGPQLAQLFQVLNTEEARRSRNLDEQLAAFPYVNGRLFEEALPIASFDRGMRDALLECCALDWSSISPAIFGALFQSIMDDKARRNLGAHYTSEENILKLIKPLFLDDLWADFQRIKGNRNKLFEFHKKLRGLSFFDPACGCGNFLVIAYRELRKLELEVLRASHESGQQVLDIHQLIRIDVDQFYGIEIEEFPAQIAQVALWLIDHQMNVRVSEEFGLYFARIPLKTTPHIHCANALRLDWNEVLPAERCTYVLGNPPFVGAKFMDDAQRADVAVVFEGIANAGLLDFVAAWYVKAAHYTKGTATRCAFVSTNSITQGEQVGVLWGWLLAQGIHIHFAHRTFQWSNEARGMAAVHCVIVGFGHQDVERKVIFEYEDIRGEPHAVVVKNINPYLVDGPDVLAMGRMTPLCNVPSIANGSIPADGGNLILEPEERSSLLASEPQAAPWIRPYVGAEGFINSHVRYCLWLVDCPPQALRDMPQVMGRVREVQRMREASAKAATREKAKTPTLFTENRQPLSGRYLALPRTSSENRRYIPIGFLPSEVIAANDLQFIPDATNYHFGVVSSAMHMAWMRTTSGRLKSDIRYSVKYTYNTFPWPENPTDKQRAAIEAAAQGVLDARAQFPGASLADLYDPVAMPPALVKAHQKLDAAIDAAYGQKGFANDAARVAFLFERYQKLTSLLPTETPRGKRGGKRAVD
ncbi:MAG: class I SAM-dependent DNA methyltransferase [Gammaproteobacteria bacterium]|nr:class I SAM-dependent DNA methyltransferase [Gammaproteobacteria bacterium]MBU1414535.1 class I SAM-dependent DNA methyltransferase [Gammaproteobacteria bacterium]